MAVGIAAGTGKGHAVTKLPKVARQSLKKGAANKRVSLVRSIVRETCGLSPYERRILDMIKTGGASAEKRIYKFAKRRLGTHKRAVQKREDIKSYNAASRAAAHK
jgi:large subunit ribosomal protein L36e